jgi:hypothetical protein
MRRLVDEARGAARLNHDQQQYRSVMLIYARCVRAHGVPNMPDPDRRGHLDIGPGSGVDVSSPRFQAAYQVCKSRLSP